MEEGTDRAKQLRARVGDQPRHPRGHRCGRLDCRGQLHPSERDVGPAVMPALLTSHVFPLHSDNTDFLEMCTHMYTDTHILPYVNMRTY